MGLIIAKFRKSKTTYEVLDKLENEIKTIEEFRRSTEQTQKRIVARFIFVSVCVYLIIALVLYFYFFPASAYERVLYIIPLIIAPILLIFLKRILQWYYNRKISKNQRKLTTLKDEKKKILEEVMDKETYKVAQKILEKFAPEHGKRIEPYTPLRPAAGGAPATGLRARAPLAIAPTPSFARTPANRQLVRSPAGTPTAAPGAMFPANRTVLDKMIEYLVGEGPSNLYALICKNCSGHNGMAVKEDFEYLSFRCYLCGSLNPARKQKPSAPEIDSFSDKSLRTDQSDSDSSESEPDASSGVASTASEGEGEKSAPKPELKVESVAKSDEIKNTSFKKED